MINHLSFCTNFRLIKLVVSIFCKLCYIGRKVHKNTKSKKLHFCRPTHF